MVPICNEHQCSWTPVTVRCDRLSLNGRENRETSPHVGVTINETVMCSGVLGLRNSSSSAFLFKGKLRHPASDVESE